MSSSAATSSSTSTLFRRTRDAEAELQLPAGFRFHPTDEELVLYYLRRRAANLPLPVPIIAEVDIYKHDPWDLPSLALFGTKEWYFFTPRDRKYPNGSRPNRAAASGYWKATGADKPVTPAGEPRAMGIKKALVFYAGKAPRGIKTNWIMHEYRLTGVSREPKAARGSAGNKGAAGSLRLDDWVLCRLYNKKNNWEKEAQQFMQMMRTQMELGVPEPSSLSAAAADSSHRTPESDVDNEVSFADEFDEAKYTLQEASPSMDLGYAHQHQFQPQPHPQPHPQQQQQQQQLPAFGGVVKEEQTTTTNYFYTNTTAPVMPNNTTTTPTTTTNDWYLDLKLDDLQSPFPAFGQPGQDLFLSPTSSSFQDWFFSSGSLNSPMLTRTASQISLLNF